MNSVYAVSSNRAALGPKRYGILPKGTMAASSREANESTSSASPYTRAHNASS